jgi:hypothetical protein
MTLEARESAEFALKERNRVAAMEGALTLLPLSEAVYQKLRKAKAEAATP